MKLQKTTTYNIKFSVETFVSTEGGMYHSVWDDKEVDTLEEAIELLEEVEARTREDDWVIVAHVEKVVS